MVAAICLLLCLSLMLMGVLAQGTEESEETQAATSGYLEYNNPDELNGAKVFGALEGTVMDKRALQYYPGVKIIYYKDLSSEALALEKGEIDAFLLTDQQLNGWYRALMILQ